MVEAHSSFEATFRLREKGLRVISMSDEGSLEAPKNMKRSLKIGDVETFNKVLLNVAHVGDFYPSSIRAAAGGLSRPDLKQALETFADRLEHGDSVSSALDQAEPSLPEIYVAMVRSGEATGDLGSALNHFGRYAVRMAALRRRITTAIAYPLTSGLIVLGLFLFMCVSIVPDIMQIYSDVGISPPVYTLFMHGIRSVVLHPVFLFLLCALAIAAGFAVRFKNRNANLRRAVGSAIERVAGIVPGVRKCQAFFFTAQLCQSLHSLVRHGTPLLEAFPIAVSATGSHRLAAESEASIARMAQGESLPDVLDDSKVLSPSLVWMLSASWPNGTVEQCLKDIGEIAEHEFDQLAANITRLLNPTLTVVVGCLVFVSMLGVFSAILELPGRFPIFNL